jgi:magnesium-transporting ATPase (P-type)
MRVMRVDTAVNGGNSGGGLFDENGNLIGIVNAKISDYRVENIAYAIPSNVAKHLADSILSSEKGVATRCILGVVPKVLSSKAVYYNLHRMLKYMIASQLAKLVLVFIAVLLGFTALTPPQILFCGLVLDFAAMIIISFEKPDYTLLGAPSKISDKLSKPFVKNLFSAIVGLFWAVVTAVSILYMVQYGLVDIMAIPTCCFVSFILTQIAMLNECKREQSVFDRNVRVNGAYVVLLSVLVIFFLLIFLVPAVGELFAVLPLSIYGVCGAILPCVVVTLVCEVYKMLGRKT